MATGFVCVGSMTTRRTMAENASITDRDFPTTEAAAARILSLPMYPELTESQIDYVVEAVANALQ